MKREALPREAPHSTEAEQSVIGALLLDNAALERIGDLLRPEDFYHADYGAMYATLQGLILAGKPADAITAHEAGGHAVADLHELAMSVPSSANAQRYAQIVHERALERRLFSLHEGAAQAVLDGRGDVASQVDKAVTDLLQLLQVHQATEPHDVAGLLGRWLDELQEMANGQSAAMATGLADLDRITSGGIWPGELWVIGARPSMGKSAMSLTLARNMACDYSALFLSQEDSLRMLLARMVAAAGRVNLADLRNPQRAAGDIWSGVTDGVERLRTLNLRIDDQAALTLLDVRRKIQQVKRRHGLHVVFIDYLQLMVGDAETRNRELGDIANGLKKAAKDFGIGIVLLSQLTRKADERSGPPQMSDLRESGDIEGAADVIAMLYREQVRKPTPENKHYAELHVCKNKNGQTDTLALHFDGAYQRFGNWDGPRPYGSRRTVEAGGMD